MPCRGEPEDGPDSPKFCTELIVFPGGRRGQKAIITALEEPVGIVVFGTVMVLVINISAVLAPPDANGTIIPSL